MAETLSDAIERNDLAQARRLLLAGSDPDAMVVEDYTPLGYCATTGRTEFVALLLEFGANPARHDRQGRSAADYARARGHHGIVRMLTEAQRGTGARAGSSQVSQTDVGLLRSIWGADIAQQVAAKISVAALGQENALPINIVE